MASFMGVLGNSSSRGVGKGGKERVGGKEGVPVAALKWIWGIYRYQENKGQD